MQKTFGKIMLMGLFLSSLAVTGCNTVEGAGEDVQSAGRSVERAAQ